MNGLNPGYLLNLLYFSIFSRCVFLRTEIPKRMPITQIFFLIILGERVSHLDKTDVYNAPKDQEEKEKREQGDDYVLSRLV